MWRVVRASIALLRRLPVLVRLSFCRLSQTENPTRKDETAWLPQVFSANC
jgi:hypothetical protein